MWNILRFLLECFGLRSGGQTETFLQPVFISGCIGAAAFRLLVTVVYFRTYGYAYTAFSISMGYCVECLTAFYLLQWLRRSSGFLHRNIEWTAPIANNVELLVYGFICVLRAQRIRLLSGRALYALFRTKSVLFYVAELSSTCFSLLPWLLSVSLLLQCLRCINRKLRFLEEKVDTDDPEALMTAIKEVVRLMDECNGSLKDCIMVGYCNQTLVTLIERSTIPYTDSMPEYLHKQVLARLLVDAAAFTMCIAGNSIEKTLSRFRKKARLTQMTSTRRNKGVELFLSLAEHLGIDSGLGQTLSFKMAVSYTSFTTSFSWVLMQTADHIRQVYEASHPRPQGM